MPEENKITNSDTLFDDGDSGDLSRTEADAMFDSAVPKEEDVVLHKEDDENKPPSDEAGEREPPEGDEKEGGEVAGSGDEVKLTPEEYEEMKEAQEQLSHLIEMYQKNPEGFREALAASVPEGDETQIPELDEEILVRGNGAEIKAHIQEVMDARQKIILQQTVGDLVAERGEKALESAVPGYKDPNVKATARKIQRELDKNPEFLSQVIARAALVDNPDVLIEMGKDMATSARKAKERATIRRSVGAPQKEKSKELTSEEARRQAAHDKMVEDITSSTPWDRSPA